MQHFIKIFLTAATLYLTALNPAFAQTQEELSAQFSSSMDHIARHGVTVVPSSDGGSLVILETAFDTRSNAELHVLLGKDGMFAPEMDLGPLAKITGLQVFRAPASIDISSFNEVHVWNPQSNIVVGVAPLQ
jgi:hypothetical protein